MALNSDHTLPTSNSLLTEGFYDHSRKFFPSVYGQ